MRWSRVIGRNWLASADKNNRRRLDDPNDFVRIEIEAALERNVPVIPVLVDGTVMPQADDLPQPLKKLARRQGIEISHNRFDSDAERLTGALARSTAESQGPRRDCEGSPAGATEPWRAPRAGSLPRASASWLSTPTAPAPSNSAERGWTAARQDEEAKPTSFR